MHAFLMIAAFCVAQEPEALKPIDVRSTIHVEGVVVDAKGQSVGDVEVFLTCYPSRREGAEHVAARTRTDAEGQFRLEARVAERPDLVRMKIPDAIIFSPALALAKPGYVLSTVSLKPEWLDGETARIELAEAEELPVRVLDPDGAPVRGATVIGQGLNLTFRPEEQRNLPGLVIVRTDEEGRARLRGLDREHASSLTIRTEKYGQYHCLLPARTELHERVYQLRTPGRLRGRVRANDPTAVRNVAISGSVHNLGRSIEQMLEAGTPSFETRTDGEGRFDVPAVGEGEYRVHAIPPEVSGHLSTSGPARVEPGKTGEVELTIDRGVVVRGSVRDRATGRPIFGARVSFSSSGLTRTATNESGQFALLMSPGRVSVRLDRTGEFCLPAHRALDFAEIPAGVVEFDLPPIDAVREQPIRGLVLDEQGDPSGPGRIHALWVEYPDTPSARVQDALEPVDERGWFRLHGVPPDAPVYVTASTEEASTGSPVLIPVIEALEEARRRMPTDERKGPGPVDRRLFSILAEPLSMDETPKPGRWVSDVRHAIVTVPVALEGGSGSERARMTPRASSVLDLRGLDFSKSSTSILVQVPVYRDQLRACEGRVIDILGHPVSGAEISVVGVGKLGGGLKWYDQASFFGVWQVRTDREGRFRTPHQVPAFLNLSVSARIPEAMLGGSPAIVYAPTTPSFFDIEVDHKPAPTEQPVWDVIQAGHAAYSHAAYDESRGRFEEALERAKALDLKDPLLRAYLLIGQARAMTGLSRFDEARALYQQALELRREVLDEDDPHVVTLLNDLAYVNKSAGHNRACVANLKELLPWGVSHKFHPIRARTLIILGDLESRLNLREQAEGNFEDAGKIYEQILPEDATEWVDLLATRVRNLDRLGKFEEAERLERRAIAIADVHHYDRYPTSQPYLASMLEEHARLLTALGREAETETRRAKALRDLRRPATVQ